MSPLESYPDEIIAEFELPQQFSPPTEQEAAAIPEAISETERRQHRDLRSQVIVTIDGETARDFDDAVSVEDIGQERLRLRVSIADVSHYVAPGSAIDRDALARGTSIYFPNRVLPMLPEKLSNQVCSLIPHEERLTVTAEIDFDKKGKVLHTDFYKSLIKSAARLTYRQVANALVGQDQSIRHELRHLLPHLEMMHTLYQRLRKVRMARGSLDFDLPEPEIIMNFEETQIEAIVRAERTQAHMMIEEFMIAANEAVARFITAKKAAMIYRVHEEPSREKLLDLQRTMHNLGYSLKVSKKKFEPQQLVSLIEKSQGRPEARLIHTLILRSLAKAAYSTDNKGHFGLASPCYTHFTSPIRRYPDLVVHRILSQLVGKTGGANQKNPHGFTLPLTPSPKKIPPSFILPHLLGEEGGGEGRGKIKNEPAASIDPRRLAQIAEHSSLKERLAMEAEWAMRDLLVALFMRDHIGKNFSGMISGVTKFGLFFELDQYFVEGLVHIRNLEDDYYRFLEEGHMLVGRKTKKRYRIGDRALVKVVGVNLEKRWVDLILAAPVKSNG